MPAQREPSDEQLRAAWQRVARPGWPTLEQLKAAAMQYALVRAFAAGGAAPAAELHRPDVLPPPVAAPYGSLRFPRGPVPIDRKRAAAGERDEE